MVSKEEFSILFHDTLVANGMEALITEQLTHAFYLLTDRMLTVNSVMNLTAITEPRELILRHYVDSLTLLPHIPTGARVLDVGCGGGFPCLPLAIARPDLHITALDSTEKKIRYVAETATLLGIDADRFEAISARAEELASPGQPLREQFDIVVSRAVARMNVLCELCLPFLRVGGQLIAMKGSKAEEELTESSNCVKILGGNSSPIITCAIHSPATKDSPLPSPAEQHALVIVKKVKKTKEIYPRKYSQILKKPL